MMHSRGEVGARWLGRNPSALSFGSRCTTPATYKPLLSRGSFLEQGGVRANSNGGEAVIRIKFCYYPYYIPHSSIHRSHLSKHSIRSGVGVLADQLRPCALFPPGPDHVLEGLVGEEVGVTERHVRDWTRRVARVDPLFDGGPLIGEAI